MISMMDWDPIAPLDAVLKARETRFRQGAIQYNNQKKSRYPRLSDEVGFELDAD